MKNIPIMIPKTPNIYPKIRKGKKYAITHKAHMNLPI